MELKKNFFESEVWEQNGDIIEEDEVDKEIQDAFKVVNKYNY